MKKIAVFTMAAVVVCTLFAAAPLCFAWTGKVVSVADGDTIKVLNDGKAVTVRLYGIDAPEMDQDSGLHAKRLVSAFVAGRDIEIRPLDVDTYGRTVGLVYVDGNVLNELMIRNGYAWVYRYHCRVKFCADWNKLEREARRQKKGMWGNAKIVPPWEWRRQHGQKAAQAKPRESMIGQPAQAAPVRPRAAGQFRCDGRVYCSQMRSCAEATFFLKNCPGTKMDGNNDGIPCEKQWCK